VNDGTHSDCKQVKGSAPTSVSTSVFLLMTSRLVVRAALVACMLCSVSSAPSPVALLEAEWQRYVARVHKELTPLQELHRTIKLTPGSTQGDDCEGTQAPLTQPNALEVHLERRIGAIEAAIHHNGHFISQFADLMLLHKRLQQDIDDGIEEEPEDPYWVSLEDTPPVHWQPCGGDREDDRDVPVGYTSVDELFAHLYRDYGRTHWDASSHRAATLEAVRTILTGDAESAQESAPTMMNRCDILVLGSGTGGLVADLRALLHDVARRDAAITATECSVLFAAAAATILSLPKMDERGESFGSLVPWVSNFGGILVGDATDHLHPTDLHSPTQHAPGAHGVRVRMVVADALAPSSPPTLAPRYYTVVTYYFIDAATSSSRHPRGILTVLDRIAQLCQPGGYWVHVGPLHYHRADTFPKLSVKEIELYMVHVHGFRLRDAVVVLPQEDYSRPNSTSLFVNAHRAVRLVMQRL
jgi:hypothetical protein